MKRKRNNYKGGANKKYKCEYCPETGFGEKKNCNKHMRDFYDRHLEKYNKNPRKFSKKPEPSKNRQWKCSECLRIYCNKYNYERHFLKISHNGLNCPECDNDKKNFNIHTLKKHLVDEHQKKLEKKRIHCKICSKPYKRPSYYLKHMKKKHGKDVKINFWDKYSIEPVEVWVYVVKVLGRLNNCDI